MILSGRHYVTRLELMRRGVPATPRRHARKWLVVRTDYIDDPSAGYRRVKTTHTVVGRRFTNRGAEKLCQRLNKERGHAH